MNKLLKIFLLSLLILTLMLVSLRIVGAAERPFRCCWGWPVLIDPAVGSSYPSITALVNLYDTLVYPDLKGMPQPHIASSWDVSDDGLAYTFHLRSGIKFHDGTELTAEDVKFSMDRLRTVGQGFAFLFTKRVQSVEVIDRNTVTINLSEPCGPFVSLLYRFYILNKDLVIANIKKPGAYDDMGDYGMEWLYTHGAASGPYMVNEFKFEEYVKLSINPNYWLPIDPNAPDEFTIFNIQKGATVITMLARREVEVGHPFHAQESLIEMDKIKGVDIARFPLGSQMYYMVNNKIPPTDDIHFRKAMAWAFDYKTLMDKVWPGQAQARGPVPQVIPGFDPTVFQYQQDLDKAMAELKQSKYYGELDKYPITIYWIPDIPDEEKIALLFMANLQEIGVTVNSVKVPWSLLQKDTSEMETSPHILTVSVAGTYPEAGSFLEARYSSESAPSWMQNEWLLDPDLDARIVDATKTSDQNERFAKYSELQHYIVDICPTIFLFDQISSFPYQSSYMDWPAAEGITPPVFGYSFTGRSIKIYPDKKSELSK